MRRPFGEQANLAQGASPRAAEPAIAGNGAEGSLSGQPGQGAEEVGAQSGCGAGCGCATGADALRTVAVPDDRSLPNACCRDCEAKLHFAPPPEPAWVQAVDRLFESWTGRIVLVVVLAAAGFFGPIWLLFVCFGVALALYLLRPPAYRPRCPRCGGTAVDLVTSPGAVPV